jgi:NADH-quinone oxidoreductase subunit E
MASTRAKPSRRRPRRPKPAAAAPDEGAVAVVEKLKSDANIAAAAASETAPSARAVEHAAKPALEPEDFRRPTEIEKPESPDDLKLISGVGPKLEQVLNGLGVWTFAQIADWKAEEIAWVDDYLQFKGRIDRDDWTSQARMLAEGGKTA